MPIKKSSASTAKKKPAAKKSATRKPKTATSRAATGDRLSEVARTIGSTVGDIVAKTKKALHRETEQK